MIGPGDPIVEKASKFQNKRRTRLNKLLKIYSRGLHVVHQHCACLGERSMTIQRIIRRITILAVAVILVSAAVGFFGSSRIYGGSSDDAMRAGALKADEEFNTAITTKDRAALERMLADNLSWIARGDRLNKSQVIADVTSENLHFKSLTHDSIIANVFGNTVVVTGHSTSILDYKGKPYTSPRLFTSVYMKLNGKWQLVAHHVTELNSENKQ